MYTEADSDIPWIWQFSKTPPAKALEYKPTLKSCRLLLSMYKFKKLTSSSETNYSASAFASEMEKEIKFPQFCTDFYANTSFHPWYIPRTIYQSIGQIARTRWSSFYQVVLNDGQFRKNCADSRSIFRIRKEISHKRVYLHVAAYLCLSDAATNVHV